MAEKDGFFDAVETLGGNLLVHSVLVNILVQKAQSPLAGARTRTKSSPPLNEGTKR